ncbi:MAG: hypothetical protein ACE5F7_11355 [Nitrospiria bacterium]
MTDKICIEKVSGGYILADANPEPRNPTDLWGNKAVFSDFTAVVEELRRRFLVSDIIASQEGKFTL